MERDEQELLARLRPLQAEARERLGAPPSPEQILAYHEGRLDATARLEVEEGVAAYPAAGRLLRDLARFPEVEPESGVATPPDDEVAARWQQFRAGRRLPSGAAPPGRAPLAAGDEQPGPRLAPVAPPPIVREPSPGVETHPSARRWPIVLALAAAVLVALGVGYLLGPRTIRPEGRINLALAALTPVGDSSDRGIDATELHVPSSAEGVLLSLGFGGAVLPAYSLTVYDPQGREILRRADLEPDGGGAFLLDLPRELLSPGRYRLELGAPGEAEPLAVYVVDLTFG